MAADVCAKDAKQAITRYDPRELLLAGWSYRFIA